MPVYSKYLKIILKGLKYKSLDNLIGREVEICSVESVENDILSALVEDIPTESSLIISTDPMFEDAMERVMAKYGFIDAEFSISTHHLEKCPRVNRNVLEELYFVNEKGSKEYFNEEDAVFGFKELVEDIEENKAYIKLFLEIENRKQRSEYIRKQYKTHNEINKKYTPELPELPKNFLITDACLSNSDFVWFNKHLVIIYLTQ